MILQKSDFHIHALVAKRKSCAIIRSIEHSFAQIIGVISPFGIAKFADEVQYCVAYREMADFDETIAIRGYVKVDVAATAQGIIRREATQSHDFAFGGAGCTHGVKDIGGAPRAAYCD